MSLAETFAKIRADFPALEQKVNGRNLVYLDSAATTLKPRPVVERISQFYLYESANVHRGAHTLSDRATENFEQARSTTARFLGAGRPEEIIFVRGTTEAANLVAQSYLLPRLKAGDTILISEMEHHANIVPWQMVAEKVGAKVRAARVLDNGDLDMEDFRSKLDNTVKMVALTACSNTLGTRVDTKKVTALAHSVGAAVFIDGAQIVAQAAVNVADIDCDFFAFSAHKIFGPFGFGVLYGKHSVLSEMPPYQGGGSMIAEVCIDRTTYNDVPFRFEAGTPHIEGAIGLKAALDYIEGIGFASIHEWEQQLLRAATEGLQNIPGIQILGTSLNKGPIISFNLQGVHHSDVGQTLDQMGVAVRAGHHCTQPLMSRLGIKGSVRASFSIYNNHQDVEELIQALRKAKELFS